MKGKKKYFPLLVIPVFIFFFLFSQLHKSGKKVDKKEYEDSHVEEVIEKKEEIETKEDNTKEEQEDTKYTVDIKGQIETPGVYTLTKGSRVFDVIQEAGGLLDNANTSLINLSKKIEDEMVIIIYSNDEINALMKEEKIVYTIVEVEKECPDTINDACIAEKKEEINEEKKEDKNEEEIKQVNLNTASLEELMKLPGIGEAKAQNIIRYRESFPFETIEQLKEVSGIGEALFEKVKDSITV